MAQFFFNGCFNAKLDTKNRFVLPQAMRYGLIEEGVLEFTIALGVGGCLAIYRKSDMEKIVERFQKKQYVPQYQKFFTLFFSTMHHGTCDKIGRLILPGALKEAVGIKGELIVAGVLNKIELWPKETFEGDIQSFLKGEGSLGKMAEEAFALLEEEEKDEE